MKILLLSTGGSCEPLVTSIKENKPDKVIFICSDDVGTTKGSYNTVNGNDNPCRTLNQVNKPNILTQVGIKPEETDKYEIKKIINFDDLNSCYTIISDLIFNLVNQKNNIIIADYTGGTKSLSAGLALAAVDFEVVSLCLVKGSRVDLLKVLDGTQRIKLKNNNSIFIKKQLILVENLAKNFEFASALDIVNYSLSLGDIPEELDSSLQELKTNLQCFVEWDRFNHTEAFKMLQINKKKNTQYIQFLKAILSSRSEIDSKFYTEIFQKEITKKFGTGYEIVDDLLLNAKRRAHQCRYDDAVGRIYRAMELLIQIKLKRDFNIKTGTIKLTDIPNQYNEIYSNNLSEQKDSFSFGLMKSYELLVDLNPSDILSSIFVSKRQKLQDLIQLRNYSLFAHGLEPISKENYEDFMNFFEKEFYLEFKKSFNLKTDLSLQFTLNVK